MWSNFSSSVMGSHRAEETVSLRSPKEKKSVYSRERERDERQADKLDLRIFLPDLHDYQHTRQITLPKKLMRGPGNQHYDGLPHYTISQIKLHFKLKLFREIIIVSTMHSISQRPLSTWFPLG